MNKAFPFLNWLFDAQNRLMNRCIGLISMQHAIQCYHFITFIAVPCSSITTRRRLVHSNSCCMIRIDSWGGEHSKQINKAHRWHTNLFGLHNHHYCANKMKEKVLDSQAQWITVFIYSVLSHICLIIVESFLFWGPKFSCFVGM